LNDSPPDATTRHVRAAIRADRESVDWIVRRFTPLLEAQARMRLAGAPVDPGEAEDVAAEAWLVALPRLRDLVPRAGRVTPVLLTFLGTTARSLCNRRIERALRRRATPLDEAVEPSAPPAERRPLNDPAAAAAVRRALDALGEPLRTIVLMRAVEGVDNRDIAEELGEAPNTISHRYRRALERLRATVPDSVFDELAED